MTTVSDEEWAEYKVNYNKVYENEAEEKMRRELFVNAKNKMEQHNKKYEAKEVSYKMALNHLADLTPEEYALRCGKNPQK